MTYVTQTRTTRPPRDLFKIIRTVKSSGATSNYSFKVELPAVVPHQTTYSWRGDRSASEEEVWFPTGKQRVPPHVRPYDTGHDFWTTKTSHRFSHPRWLDRWEEPSYRYVYEGVLLPRAHADVAPSQGTYPVLARMSKSESDRKGSELIAQTIPTAPSVSLAQFIGELKDLPSIPLSGLLRSDAGKFRSIGSEYLNVEFGWKPFIADLIGAVEALRERSRVLTQYSRDSGTVVRRRRSTPSETSWSSGTKQSTRSNPTLEAGYSLWATGLTDQKDVYDSPVSIEDITTSRYMFSGAYTYHLPLPEGVIGKLERFEAEANRLLGTRLTPSVLWELAPWSWLVDWNGTIGEALSNASAFAGDELVLRYGYLMKETLQQRTYRCGPFHLGGRSTGVVSHILRRTTKERVRANPYGFTLSLSSYNERQWAILGALGMTRAPRRLP